MAEVFPKDILLRVGARTLQRHGVLAVAGSRRGLVDVPITFSRADASTCATYIDRDGILRLAAANVPRIEWVDLDGDGIRETPGLLLEGSRTNLCLQSEAFGTTWTDIATPVVTSNTDVAPDGATTADTITDDNAAAFEGRQQVFTVANDSLPHVFFIFVKKTTAATNTFGFNLSLSGGTGVASTPRLNTNSGVVSSGFDTQAISVGNYWLFVSRVTNNTTGNTTLTLSVYPASGTNSGSNPGADDVAAQGSAVVWGAQLEKAAFRSSYIKTTTAAVIRAADSLTLPFNFGPLDTTILARFARPAWADPAIDIGFFPGIYSLGNGVEPHLQAYRLQTAAQYQVAVSTPGADSFSPSANIPAGATQTLAAQFKNLTTAGQAAHDSGSSYGAFGSAAAAFSTFGGAQTLSVGRRVAGSEFYGVLLDILITRGLFSLAEMTAIP